MNDNNNCEYMQEKYQKIRFKERHFLTPQVTLSDFEYLITVYHPVTIEYTEN